MYRYESICLILSIGQLGDGKQELGFISAFIHSFLIFVSPCLWGPTMGQEWHEVLGKPLCMAWMVLALTEIPSRGRFGQLTRYLHSIAGFPTSALLLLGNRKFFVVGDCPVPCGVLSIHPDFYSLDISNIPFLTPSLPTKRVSRHCKVLPVVESHQPEHYCTTGINVIISTGSMGA